ncbi:geranylgeranylglycerol-phosphate geranylgeranyltransferase [candidate division WOR-3 bacterium]|nr:geranylgeranylglycerol-phosphate geranylgeranyltransferase [candidate division WOR-3 bacterium]
MRLINSLIAGISVLLGAFLSGHSMKLSVYLSILSVILITIGGNLINDYFDRDIDRINKPQRLIPSGRLSDRGALFGSFCFFLIGALILVFIDLTLLWIGLFSITLLILYTPFLKPYPLIGNIAISLLLALTLLVGSISASGNINTIFFPVIFAFFLNLPREILKDGEDLIGDRKAGLRTFPIVFGIEKTCHLTIALLSLLILSILIAIPYYGASFGICAGFGVVVPVIIMIKRRKKSPSWFRQTQQILKISIFNGILALFISGIN